MYCAEEDWGFQHQTPATGISSNIFTDETFRLAFPTETEVFDRFNSVANKTAKKVAITNTYTISDSRHGGDEFYQAEFVRHLFNTIELLASKLEFVCWNTIYDYPPGYLIFSTRIYYF